MAHGIIAANDPVNKYDPSGMSSVMGSLAAMSIMVALNTIAFPQNLFASGTEKLGWLEFTGSRLNWYVGQYENRTKMKRSIFAVSGLPDYQSPEFTGLKETGPIPEGNYYINLHGGVEAKITPVGGGYYALSPGDGIQTVPEAFWEPWGKLRARIWRRAGTDTKGRGSFYLHSSNKGYTHGCIETAGVVTIFGELIKYRQETNEKMIFLKVKYYYLQFPQDRGGEGY